MGRKMASYYLLFVIPLHGFLPFVSIDKISKFEEPRNASSSGVDLK